MTVRKAGIFAALVALAGVGCAPEPGPVRYHAPDAIPQRLSEWQLFELRGNRLVPHEETVRYELNTPLFSDYALKLRTLWMPAGTAATYDEAREFDFPAGTILTKTFHYAVAERDGAFRRIDAEAMPGDDGGLDLDAHRLVETRLLVRHDDGWHAYPYVWNEAGDEAFLSIAGAAFEFRFASGESFPYLVPDANQCAACHTPDFRDKALRPLGLKAHQLNRTIDYTSGSSNQLAYWKQTGRLAGFDIDADAAPQSARWHDPGDATLDELVRAYLDANCAHCHNPHGPADTSALSLTIDAAVDRRFGICKPPVAVGRGSGDRPYDIYPGRPELSITLFRMQDTDPAIMMPELGRTTVHVEAVAMLREWIAALPGGC